MTPQEVKLWVHLRNLRRERGWHFRRQAPFRDYILDFVCHQAKLVIELDGSQHVEAAAHDVRRDALLAREGYTVLRFWNAEVDEPLDGVWMRIMDALRVSEGRRRSDEGHASP